MGFSSYGGSGTLGVMSVPVLLVTGPVGVGKTTIAFEASDRLEGTGFAHAVIDVDAPFMVLPHTG